jgi:hypothetical protein
MTARRTAANIAKLPELSGRRQTCGVRGGAADRRRLPPWFSTADDLALVLDNKFLRVVLVPHGVTRLDGNPRASLWRVGMTTLSDALPVVDHEYVDAVALDCCFAHFLHPYRRDSAPICAPASGYMASHLHSAAGESLPYQDSYLISRAKLFRG